jgi:hypothetical protein
VVDVHGAKRLELAAAQPRVERGRPDRPVLERQRRQDRGRRGRFDFPAGRSMPSVGLCASISSLTARAKKVCKGFSTLLALCEAILVSRPSA